jgi:hypothetical protein
MASATSNPETKEGPATPGRGEFFTYFARRIFFRNSDCLENPGILRNWVNVR